MNCSRSYRVVAIFALLAGNSASGHAGPQPGPRDLTSTFEAFARKVNEASRNRNEFQLKQAVEAFHREVASYEGKVVRCEFRTTLIKPHRVLLDNPILGDKTRYRFVFFAGNAASLRRVKELELEAAMDQVIVAGVPQPVPVFEKLASVTPKFLENFRAGDRVVITGTLMPRRADQYGMNYLELVNARVVEP